MEEKTRRTEEKTSIFSRFMSRSRREKTNQQAEDRKKEANRKSTGADDDKMKAFREELVQAVKARHRRLGMYDEINQYEEEQKKEQEKKFKEADTAKLKDQQGKTDRGKKQNEQRLGMCEEISQYLEERKKEQEKILTEADKAKLIDQQEKTYKEEKQNEQITKPLLVGAIDFGTTYSGWACSFLHEFNSDPTKAFVKQWYSGSGSLTTEKTPTCVLVQPDGETLEAFGYEAENKYKDLVDAENHGRYYYFKKFKMMLNRKLGEKLDRGITLEDEMGRSLPAIDVFAMAITYLKQDMLYAVEDKLMGVLQDTDVHWVLTVPAIWTDGAKQFMREAANKAGITGNHLVIALEPEAASVYCRNLSVQKTLNQSEVSIAKLKAGTQYMVLDAGGGTIDITVHEVEESGGVKEVHAACGGGWGGTIVDKAFERMLLGLFTRQVYEKFKIEETEDWLDLWRDFEVKKRAFNPTKPERINMKFPLSLIEMFMKETRNSFPDALSRSEFANDITISKDKLKFSTNIFRSLFDTSLEKTIGYVKEVIRDTEGVKAILMVGGFSESPVLQHAVKSSFPGIRVVIPKDASSTVLRGALIFGHSPKSITYRMLKYTYGIETTSSFIEGIHPESKRLKYKEGDVCDKIFNKHVEKNQLVEVGEPQVERSYLPFFKTQTELRFSIYASELESPQYTDEGCKFIGNMNVKLSTHGNDFNRSVMTSLTFSGTEIVVNARETRTGIETSANIDFLG